MAEPVAVGAVQVRPIVQGVHLVDTDARQLVGRALDRVEQRDRLAVGERHDQVGSRADVIEHSLGRYVAVCGHRRGPYRSGSSSSTRQVGTRRGRLGQTAQLVELETEGDDPVGELVVLGQPDRAQDELHLLVRVQGVGDQTAQAEMAADHRQVLEQQCGDASVLVAVTDREGDLGLVRAGHVELADANHHVVDRRQQCDATIGVRMRQRRQFRCRDRAPDREEPGVRRCIAELAVEVADSWLVAGVRRREVNVLPGRQQGDALEPSQIPFQSVALVARLVHAISVDQWRSPAPGTNDPGRWIADQSLCR